LRRNITGKGIVFCLDAQELDDAARLMETKKVRRLPVINNKKRMIGSEPRRCLSRGAASREQGGNAGRLGASRSGRLIMSNRSWLPADGNRDVEH